MKNTLWQTNATYFNKIERRSRQALSKQSIPEVLLKNMSVSHIESQGFF